MSKIILGVDPGIGRMGFGLIRENKEKLTYLDHGCIVTSQKKTTPDRLLEIYSDLKRIIAKCHPHLVCLEEIYFAKNIKTAMQVSQAKGLVQLICAQKKVPLFSLTPLQLKKILTGQGNATKAQMQKMVQIILSLKKKPAPDDAADALALAIAGSYGKFLK